jgi:hypothetical protein
MILIYLLVFGLCVIAWKFISTINPNSSRFSLPKSFRPKPDTIICFSTKGSMAQIHEFDYIGTIVERGIIQHNMEWVKVRIVKDNNGYDIHNINPSSGELEYLYRNEPLRSILKSEDGLFFIYK